ncbi:MAG: hypothetical protein GF311_28280 [Candidatus Lokiarchaeota archaeon]|nr:hypothetical protein [Candidatus Lokiarchaeota archaeon]
MSAKVSRRELLEKAVKENEEKRALEEQKKENKRNKVYTSATFQEKNYFHLETNAFRVFRLLGAPIRARQENWDAKLIRFSQILDDKGSKRNFVWPDKQEFYEQTGKQFILDKVYNKVLAYDWDDVNRVRCYKHSKTHPVLFNRVMSNNQPENAFASGWKPSKIVVANVIDRQDMDWHKTHKKTKLISSKLSLYKKPKDGKTISFYKEGIPYSLYETIEKKVSVFGPAELYDLVVKKINGAPYYEVYSASETQYFKNSDILPLINPQEEIPEELSWEKYDLDTMFKVSSYSKILFSLGEFILAVDDTFKTNFHTELVDLVEKEREGKQSTDSNSEEVSGEEVKDMRHEPVIARKKINFDRDLGIEDFNPDSLDSTKYKGILKLTEKEKSYIIGVDEKGFLKYRETDDEGNPVVLASGFEDDELSPIFFQHCPYSGVKLVD